MSVTDWVVGLSALAGIALALLWLQRRVVRLFRRIFRRPQLANLPVEPQAVAPGETIVLPSPRRTRDKNAQPQPPTQTKRAIIRPMRHSLRRLDTMTLPIWLPAPFAFLGLIYLVSVPFGTDWWGYGTALFLAALFGWYTRRRWASTCLERTENGGVYWVRKRRKGETERPPTYTAPSDLTGQL